MLTLFYENLHMKDTYLKLSTKAQFPDNGDIRCSLFVKISYGSFQCQEQ